MIYPLYFGLLLAAGGPWATLAGHLTISQLASEREFNELCKQVVLQGAELFPGAARTKRFSELLAQTRPAQRNKRIPTDWGGVYVTSYDQATRHYEKFLIVEGGHWLAFERHAEKTETLVVEEGLGVLLYRDKASGKIAVRDFQPGVSITLQPGEEHCLIAIRDLVVREHGVDPKGMDQDLVFIYKPTP